MIIGIGTDLANIERIAATLDRFGDRFRNRVFTETEQRKAERRRDIAGTYAKRWAAKEAFESAWHRIAHGHCVERYVSPQPEYWPTDHGRHRLGQETLGRTDTTGT